MKVTLLLSLCVATSLLVSMSQKAQAQSASGSDIYIGKIKRSEQGLSLVKLKAVTNNEAYSNQPYFFNEDVLYFTQEIDGQMDTMKYRVSDGALTNVTKSVESEYSPTPMPNGEGFSVIRVNAEGKQELWQIGFDGTPISHLAKAAEPVGYQVWTKDDKVLLFVLGEPHTLRYLDPYDNEDKGAEIAQSIGASLFIMPNTDGYTYTIENESKPPQLWWFNPRSGEKKKIAELPKNTKYYAWGPSAELFTTDKGSLVSMPFIVERNEIVYTAFKEVEIRGDHCKKGISRIAVSPYDEQIAIVCNR